ncbi:MAG: SDR family NAD(P)-dependent oxidoreductase [Deltaproteobacteria bacterium]|jgi:NAD(P)-dependent dehydrogenase (short-subunit alcohol dehydrogenase family)|nr:SDR family NAD(P)-dependent oxidoreductase [Deltaproteobacteria bacterium]
MKKLKDRVAVVTGAAGGIGRAMVGRFVDAGMKVVLAGINAARIETVVEEFKDSGARVLGVPTDVSDPGQVEELARRTLDEFGAVHVLCNNAGVAYGGPGSWETPLEAWKWVLDVNLMGVLHGIHTFIPIMLEQGDEAHVVNTASNSGLIMNSYAVPYGVSKHAVVALSESLHLELMQRNSRVKVSVLCPGPVNTDILNASQRNLPGCVAVPAQATPEETIFKKAYEIYLERGLDPQIVGQKVLEAIREEQFYIITHDYNSAIETRMQNILNAKNPEPQPPTPEFLNIVEAIASSNDRR